MPNPVMMILNHKQILDAIGLLPKARKNAKTNTLPINEMFGLTDEQARWYVKYTGTAGQGRRPSELAKFLSNADFGPEQKNILFYVVGQVLMRDIVMLSIQNMDIM